MIRSPVKIARRSQGLAAKVAKRVLATVIGWACFLNAVQLFPPPLNAQEIDERVIKAAYVFNLTKYVNWPNTGKPLVVGFVGDGPTGRPFCRLAQQAVQAAPVPFADLVKPIPVVLGGVKYMARFLSVGIGVATFELPIARVECHFLTACAELILFRTPDELCAAIVRRFSTASRVRNFS